MSAVHQTKIASHLAEDGNWKRKSSIFKPKTAINFVAWLEVAQDMSTLYFTLLSANLGATILV